MSRKPTESIDYTSRDYEAYRELMLQKLKEKIPEYTDTSQTDAGIVILECLANGLDICSLYSDVIANDVLLPTTQDRRIACILARNLGYTPYNQTASVTPQVFVLNKVKDTDTLIGKGTVVTTKVDSNMTAITFETEEDLIIPANCLGDEKDSEGNYKYVVNVIHGSTINDDRLGTSKGTAYQTFKLNFPKVLVDSIRLYVDEGDGAKLWNQVDSFLDSNIDEKSKVYTVTVDEFDNCYIEFGNGVRGKIPTPFENGISANYRIGGGESGNVQANTITVVETSLSVIDSTFNPSSSIILGHDKETLEEIKQNAPASFKTRERVVTLDDYSDVLRVNNKGNLYAILNTKALRDEDLNTKVLLYYQLREGYTMTNALKQEIKDFFAPKTMIGTAMELAEYTPYTVNLSANLIIDKDYPKTEVENNVQEYIKGAFFNYGAFTFGDDFVKSDLESEIKSTIEGVRSFRITSPDSDIISVTTENQIITLGTITLTTTGGKED